MTTLTTLKDVTMPLKDMGYEIRIIRPAGASERVWAVYSESGKIFSGTYKEFLLFRLKELETEDTRYATQH